MAKQLITLLLAEGQVERSEVIEIEIDQEPGLLRLPLQLPSCGRRSWSARRRRPSALPGQLQHLLLLLLLLLLPTPPPADGLLSCYG